MRGYLLDTNILSYWFNEKTPEHKNIVRHLGALDANSPLRISVISLGEVEYGHRCESDTDTVIQTAFKDFVNQRLPDILRIQPSTSIHYGQIRARLFKRFAPPKGRNGLRPCQLVDPITAVSLGIQENDLWLAAQAVEFNLVLVTHDRMRRIQEASSDLLVCEDWAV